MEGNYKKIDSYQIPWKKGQAWVDVYQHPTGKLHKVTLPDARELLMEKKNGGWHGIRWELVPELVKLIEAKEALQPPAEPTIP